MPYVALSAKARQLDTDIFTRILGTANWRIAEDGVDAMVAGDGLHANSAGTQPGFFYLRKGFNSAFSLREDTFKKVAFELTYRPAGNADQWQPKFRIDYSDSHHRHHEGALQDMTVVDNGDGTLVGTGVSDLPFNLPRNWIADVDFVLGWEVPAGAPGEVVMRRVTTWADSP